MSWNETGCGGEGKLLGPYMVPLAPAFALHFGERPSGFRLRKVSGRQDCQARGTRKFRRGEKQPNAMA